MPYEDENTTTLVGDGEMVLLFVEKEECRIVDSCVIWVVDSESSYHAASNKEFFVMYKVGDFGKVKIDNNNIVDIVGINDVCVFKPISVSHQH